MHALWNPVQKFRREVCNAFCRNKTHAMVVWANTAIPETEELLAGWNPEVAILSVEPAPEAPRPTDEEWAGTGDDDLTPWLVRFRVVMETPEAA